MKLVKWLKSKKSGVTLLELLVVVAILAILAAILIPAYNNYAEQARETRAESEIGELQQIIGTWMASTNGIPPEASDNVADPNSIANVMMQHGINWTGDGNGLLDPWGNPYYYAVVNGNGVVN